MKKNVKRILVVFLAGLICFGSLAACEQKNPPPSQSTINGYNPEAGINRDRIENYIVKAGTSDYAIVYGAEASETEKTAAGVMQEYLEKATGVRLPVMDERLYIADKNIISIGKTLAFSKLNITLDYKSLNGDGFVLKTQDKNLFIAGAIDRGTLYGVYDFLEKICSVRFYDINYEVVPKQSEVPLYEMNVTEIPSFEYRGYLTDATMHLAGTHGADAQKMASYYTKCRYTHEMLDQEVNDLVNEKYGKSIQMSRVVNQTHSNLQIVPVAEYYATEEQQTQNTDMFEFGTVDGVYRIMDICYTSGITEDGKLEETDEMTTAKAYLDGLKRIITIDPDSDFYMVGQEDCYLDFCQRCKTRQESFNSYTPLVIKFYSVMAREIQKWADEQEFLNGKKINLVCFCYKYSIYAPAEYDENTKQYVSIDPTLNVPNNLSLRFADLDSKQYYSFIDQEKYSMGFGPDYLDKWTAVLGDDVELWYWGYNNSFESHYTYLPTLQKTKRTLIALEKANTQYVFMEDNYKEYLSFQAIMNNYVMNKMLWNPHRDLNEIREEFIEGYYGLISEEMRAFIVNYDEQAGAFMKNGGTEPDLDTVIATPLSFLNMQLGILDKATEKVEKSTISAFEKQDLLKKIQIARLNPLFNTIIHREVFYSTTADKNAVTKEFYDIAEKLGVKWVNEAVLYSTFKDSYPLL